MKKYFIALVTIFLSASLSALAEPPEGSNNAEIFKPVFCPFLIVVDPGPGITPIFPGGYGVIATNLNADDGKLVVTNSGNGSDTGNAHLNCHAEIVTGAVYDGFDGITLEPVQGTVTPFEEACVAVNLVFPGTCNVNGAATLKGESLQVACNVAGTPTFDWRQVTTKSGKVTRVCHATN